RWEEEVVVVAAGCRQYRVGVATKTVAGDSDWRGGGYRGKKWRGREGDGRERLADKRRVTPWRGGGGGLRDGERPNGCEVSLVAMVERILRVGSELGEEKRKWPREEIKRE
ncbi:hypothetical protein Drorol1_Dr00021555, partial [Drosera rotundifolia]